MKKSTTILMGLFLCTASLAACGNKKSQHKVLDRDEFGYKVEFKEIYNGRKDLEARNNLSSQLTSDKLVAINGTQIMQGKVAPYVTVYSQFDGSFTFYNNGVYEINSKQKQSFCEGNFTETYESETKETAMVVGKQIISFEENNEMDGTDIDYDVDSWNPEDDISAYADLASIAYSGLTAGIDTNGNGIMYSQYFNQNSNLGFNANGDEITVYDFEIEEMLVMFEGDPTNSKPWGVFIHDISFALYDEDHIVTEEPQIEEEMSVEYSLTYGKRKEYKNKDDMLKGCLEEKFEEEVDCDLTVFEGVTIESDKKSISNIPGYSTYYSSEGYVDLLGKDRTKSTGLEFTDYEIDLSANDALAVEMYYYTTQLDYDKVADEYAESYDNGCILAEISCDNLPEGLMVLPDDDGNNYIVAEKDVSVYVTVEWETSIEKTEGGNIIKAKANVTLSDHLF